MSELRTPLTSWHEEHGAKMAPFAGWLMPIQYEGILAEHLHTRTHAGLFDICHMGEFRVQGPNAESALSRALSHNLATLAIGRCRYGFLLNEQGGVLDDCIIYHLEPDVYVIVVNAACKDSDLATIKTRLPKKCRLVFYWLAIILCVLFFGIMAYVGFVEVLDEYEIDSVSEALAIPVWWYTIATPLFSILIIFRMLQKTCDDFRSGHY